MAASRNYFTQPRTEYCILKGHKSRNQTQTRNPKRYFSTAPGAPITVAWKTCCGSFAWSAAGTAQTWSRVSGCERWIEREKCPWRKKEARNRWFLMTKREVRDTKDNFGCVDLEWPLMSAMQCLNVCAVGKAGYDRTPHRLKPDNGRGGRMSEEIQSDLVVLCQNKLVSWET